MRFEPQEVEHAQRVVYAALPPTPQYAWPLLRERLGIPIYVKHENHTPAGAFKVRGGQVYFDQLARIRESPVSFPPRAATTASRSAGAHASTAWMRPSWYRTATRSRKTRRCAHSVCT